MSVELANAYWTSAGPVEVHFGREWSEFDFADRCAEAARVGFVGLGLWHADIEHQLESRSLADMRRILDDNGIRCYELEFLMDWFVDEGEDARRESDRMRELLFEAGNELDAHHIKVGNIPGTPCEMPRLKEAYAELCADAARAHLGEGALRVHALRREREQHRVRAGGDRRDREHRRRDRHLAHGQARDRARRPAEVLGRASSAGSSSATASTRTWRTRSTRSSTAASCPGEGEFDIRGYVEVALDMGYSEPWGVEVLSEDLRALPMDEMYRRSYESAASQVEPVAA